VVLVITDDVGYADIGSYGARDIKTPNIDSLAAWEADVNQEALANGTAGFNRGRGAGPGRRPGRWSRRRGPGVGPIAVGSAG
jgi:hypothetical protein